MKIMSDKEFQEKITDISKKYNLCGIHDAWMKINRYIIPGTIFISVLLALYSQNYYKSFLLNFFKVEKIGLTQGMQLAIMIIICLVLVNTALIVLHELLHILSYPKTFSNAIIVTNLPFAISAAYDGWLTKNTKMKSLIFPFIILSLLIFFLFFVIGEFLIVVWLLLFNAILSSSDIYAFFYIKKYIPNNALMYENYIRCQR